MSLLTNFSKSLSDSVGNFSLGWQKYNAPILFGIGIAGVVGSMIGIGVASVKSKEVVDSAKERLDYIEECETHEELCEFYGIEPDTEPEVLKEYTTQDMKRTYLTCAAQILKRFAVPVGVAVASIICLTKSNAILKERVVGIAAAYASLDAAFKNYRKRVAESYGEETEDNLYHGLSPINLTKLVENDDGSVKKVKTKGLVASSVPTGAYQIYFDENHFASYAGDERYDRITLQTKQNWLNDLLNMKKWVSYNDALSYLNVEPQYLDLSGQYVGWVKNNPEDIIDFGARIVNVVDENDPKKAEEKILLSFNVQGPLPGLAIT